MKYLLLLLILVPTFGKAQSKLELFCIENGLEIVGVYEDKVVAKFITNDNASLMTAVYGYEFEAIFYFNTNEAKLTSLRNTKTSNNGVNLSMTEYRGGFKENITKKSWERIIGNVNKKCQEIIDKFNEFIKL